MSIKDTRHLMLAAALLIGTPAVAQQNQAAGQQGQNATQQNQGGGQQGQATQTMTIDGTLPPLVVSIDFTAVADGVDDPLGAAAELARDDRIASVTAITGADTAITGTLVVESLDAFAELRGGAMDDLFAPVGGADAVSFVMTAFRPSLLRTSDPETLLDGLDELTIEYTNTGNHAAGDSDIDAVTVICTGGDANCTPSN
jgi:hypothetical protein